MKSNIVNISIITQTIQISTLQLVIYSFLSIIQLSSADDLSAFSNYLIPSYYGSRNQDFATWCFVSQSNYSSFYWTHGIDVDDQTNPNMKTFYVIDANEQTIKSITDQFVVTILASTSGGFRDGDIRNSLFNNSKALAFFRQNKYKAARAQYKQVAILSQNTAECMVDPTPLNCINSSFQQNSTVSPLYLGQTYKYPEGFDTSQLPDQNQYLNEVLIVADTQNHCIRKIDLVTKITQTIAGQCTVSGFLDGPIGTNLMNSPSSLGVDDQGIIFFYDEYYDQIRMIDPVTTFVSTLLKGACREDITYQPKQIFQKFQKKRVVCYKSWVNVNAPEPQGHKYQENLSSICQLQQSLCPTTSSSEGG
ncbi:hypothetical protein ABPG74_021883 [Tetrahymena malaccensis]